MSEMKDSGIEWIGDIPINWDVNKIKFITKIPITDGPHETPVFVDEGVPFYSVDGIQNEHIVYEPCRYISTEDADRYDRKIIPSYGDILMGKAASVGKIAIIDRNIRMQVWSPLAIIRTNENFVHNKFLKYYLLSDSAQIEIDLKSTTNTQKNIAMEDIENIILPVPKVKEQQMIASLLDNKVGKIGEILNDLNKQIEILNKYKKSLITEIVTNGLNPNVEMKESEINCIGRIPKHWKIKRTLNMLSMPITDGPHTTPDLYDEGIPFVSAEAVSCGNGKIDFDHIRGYISDEFYKECCKKYIPKKYDIYMIKSGATTGRVAIVETEDIFTIWSPLAVFRCNEQEILYKFMFYSLQSTSFQVQVENNWTYGTQQNISMRTLEHLKICQPPMEEQKQIVDYLDKKCKEIDKLIEDKQVQIEKMEKYKKSLIYEYVTGKKRVKGAEELYG